MRYSSSKSNNTVLLVVALILAVGFVLWLVPFAAQTEAAPPAQPTPPLSPAALPPRPTVPPAPDEGGEGGPEAEAPTQLTIIRGVVIEWGFRNAPNVLVRLAGESWVLETITSDDGRFSFGPLGMGLGRLNLVPGPGSALKPMTTDITVFIPGTLGDITVNLGAYTGPDAPTTVPVHMTMAVEPATAAPGQEVVYSIQVTNNMPHGISEVMVTDFVGPEFELVNASASRGTIHFADDPLVTAYIGEIASGGTETVTIQARIAKGAVPGSVIENRASVVYRESVAIQSEAAVTVVGEAAPTALTAQPTSAVGGEVAPTPVSAEPDALPVTGYSLPLPGVAVVLALLMFASRRMRTDSAG